VNQPTTGERALIVNADDFGRTPGINLGVIRAHEHGIVTSASLMVRWPAATAAADYGGGSVTLSLGLHVDVCEWAYRDGSWYCLYEAVPMSDYTAVVGEVHRQFDTFRRLVGRSPTHVDSHQHVHQTEPVRSAVLAAAGRLGIPVRGCSECVRYCGDFYGQSGKGEPWPAGITTEALVQLIAALPAGTTELSCHPGEDVDFDSVYQTERATEVQVLCDPRVRAALIEHDVRLQPFPPTIKRPDWHTR
jgi:predicted glycoside hydrolase/deacetylase ChbG (UPF0249 family)